MAAEKWQAVRALIDRLTIATPEVPRAPRLLVETTGRGTKFGCRIANIVGSTPGANAIVRKAAETILDGTATCIEG